MTLEVTPADVDATEARMRTEAAERLKREREAGHAVFELVEVVTRGLTYAPEMLTDAAAAYLQFGLTDGFNTAYSERKQRLLESLAGDQDTNEVYSREGALTGLHNPQMVMIEQLLHQSER